MKLFRLTMFVFFCLFFLASVDCLTDAARELEYFGASLGAAFSLVGIIITTIDPSK